LSVGQAREILTRFLEKMAARDRKIVDAVERADKAESRVEAAAAEQTRSLVITVGIVAAGLVVGGVVGGAVGWSIGRK